MKTATILAVALLLALGATAAMAQCPTACPQPEPVCPQPAATCPQPEPVCPQPAATCPQPEPVCPPQCPQPEPVCPTAPRCCPTELATPPAQCPCPQANPAALGAGPAGDLCGLECQDFDQAYVEKMYNQNVAVIALTTEGIQRATDKNLRDISGEIRTQTTSANVKLANWYAQMGYGTIPVDYSRVQTIVDSLSEPMGQCFDVAYAQTLSGLLKQSRDADSTVADRGALEPLRAQADFMMGKNDNYITRLDRWVAENG